MLLVLIQFGFFCLLVPHMFVSKHTAKELVSRWKPQIICGELFSTSGVNSYVKGLITLEDSRCSGALVRCDSSLCIFFVSVQKNVTHVLSRMYSEEESEKTLRNDLRLWHEYNFPDSVLVFLY